MEQKSPATNAADGAHKPGSNGLASHIGFVLARSNAKSMASGNSALAPFDLKLRSFSVLQLVAQGARPSQREIAEFLRLDPSQVVALVDKLQQRGLVAREPDPNDRRANVVVATEAGKALAGPTRDAVAAAEREMYSMLSEEQREQLAHLLSLIAFAADPEDG